MLSYASVKTHRGSRKPVVFRDSHPQSRSETLDIVCRLKTWGSFTGFKGVDV